MRILMLLARTGRRAGELLLLGGAAGSRSSARTCACTHCCWARTIATTSPSTKIVFGAPSIFVCINAGVPVHVVQRYLGHLSAEMTMRYAHTLRETHEREFLRGVQAGDRMSAEELGGGERGFEPCDLGAAPPARAPAPSSGRLNAPRRPRCGLDRRASCIAWNRVRHPGVEPWAPGVVLPSR